MPTSKLSAIFRALPTYNHQPVPNISPDDECFICQEPYVTKAGVDEGCYAIRLTACSHVIGHKCFAEWAARMPDTCPYWNHHIPSIPQPCLPDENAGVTILRWLCSTRWFIWVDDFLCRLEHMRVLVDHIQACSDLRNNQLTFKGAYIILMEYVGAAVADTVLLGLLSPALFAVSTLTLKVFLMGWGSDLPFCQMLRFVVVGTYLIWVSHTIIFLTLASWALALALYRSTRRV